MLLRRALLIGAGVLVGAAGTAGGWVWLHPAPKTTPTMPAFAHGAPSGGDDEDAPEVDELPTVKTGHPRRDKAFTVTVHQFATVEPYYSADLRARASGVVKYVPKDVGSR